MTLAELDEIEARAKAATEGPWTVETRAGRLSGEQLLVIQSQKRLWVSEIDVSGDDKGGPSDALFIAAARADVPALVDEVRRLRAELGGWVCGERCDAECHYPRCLELGGPFS